MLRNLIVAIMCATVEAFSIFKIETVVINIGALAGLVLVIGFFCLVGAGKKSGSKANGQPKDSKNNAYWEEEMARAKHEQDLRRRAAQSGR